MKVNFSLSELLTPKSTSHCIICKERFPSKYVAIQKDGLSICTDCDKKIDKFISPAIYKGRKSLKFLISPYPYSGPLKKAFKDYKFASQRMYSVIFSRLLENAIKDIINKDDFDLIIPVPLSKERMIERGYNQVSLIIEPIAEALQIEYSEKSLFRIRNTLRQSDLGAIARNKNVRGAFLANKEFVSGKSILLADDIYTHGATMEECASTLLLAGAKSVSGITLFKSIFDKEMLEKKSFIKRINN